MPAPKTVTVRLDRSQPKKTSVRYDAPLSTPPAVLRTIYISNEAAEALGQPDTVMVTIEAVPAP